MQRGKHSLHGGVKCATIPAVSAGMVKLVDTPDLGDVTSVKGLSPVQALKTQYAGMVELVDTQDLGSCAARRVGSSPTTRTMRKRQSIRLPLS